MKRKISNALETGTLDAVNLDRVDQPVRVSERLRLRSNVGVAAGVDLGTGRRAPDTSGPVAAEGDVEDL
jgi:hypothetical protein